MNENENKEINEEVIEQTAEEVLEEKTSESEEVYAFKWEYSEQLLYDKNADNKKRKSSRGAITYGIVMTVAFLLAFAALAVSLTLGNFTIGNTPVSRELSVTDIVEKGLPSTVGIVAVTDENSASGGSGFVINDYGYIVTNYHVIEDSIDISIIDYSGNWFAAELIGYDENIDIAVLYSEHAELSAVSLADSSMAVLGEIVVAIGCPVGSEAELFVSNGIISGFKAQSSTYPVGMIQTNAPLNPGNSGGPLFDSKGNVVGIVTSKLVYTTNGDGEKIPLDGISYALPINSVKAKIESWIIKDLQTPKMGLSGVSVTEGKEYFYSGNEGVIYLFAEENGVKYKVDAYGTAEKLTVSELEDPSNIVFKANATGIFVVGVTKGLGADGKLQKWDIVTELDGQKVSSVSDAKIVFQKFKAGDTLKVKFCRNGEMFTVDMILKTKGDMLAAERNS